MPAIVQDATSGRVLMMAWMNDDSLALTLADTGTRLCGANLGAERATVNGRDLDVAERAFEAAALAVSLWREHCEAR